MKKVLIIFLLLMFFLVSSFVLADYSTYTERFNNWTLSFKPSSSTILNYTPAINLSKSYFNLGLAGYPGTNFSITNINSSVNYSFSMKLAGGSYNRGVYVFYIPECDIYTCLIKPKTRINFTFEIIGNSARSTGNYNSYFGLVKLNNKTSINYDSYAFKMLFMDDENNYAGGFCDLPLKYPNNTVAINNFQNDVPSVFNYNMSLLSTLFHTDYYGHNTSCSDSIFYNNSFNAFYLQADNIEWDADYVFLNFSIDNLEIKDIFIYNQTNTLPNANITINDGLTGCLEKNENQKTFNVSIDASDFENDEILYSYLSFDYNYINKTVYYNKKNCIFFGWCINYVPDDLFSNILYYGDNNSYCQIEKSSLFIFENPSSYYSFASETLKDGVNYELMLYLSRDTCSIDNRYFYYYFDNPIQNLYYHTEIYDFNTNLEQFNISFFSPDFSRVKTFSFWLRDNLNITVYETRTLSGGLNILGGIPDYNTSLDISIGGGLLTLKQGNYTNMFNYTLYINDSYKYVALNIFPATSIKQRGFDFAGLNKALAFTNQKPETITFYQTGLFEVDYYLTDDYNYQIQQYRKIPVYFQVDKCDNIIPPIDYEVTDTLKTSFMGLCGALDGAGLNGFSFCLLFAFILSIVALLIAGVMALIFLSIAPGFALPVFMFVFSLVMILGSFIIELNFTFKMILGIMFAFSLALFLKGLFIGSNEV